MKDILFLLKMLGLTAVLVLAMQIHIGEETAESHFHQWLRTSSVVDFLQSAVDGGLIAAKTGYVQAKGAMDPLFARFSKKKAIEEHGEGHREKIFQIKRHSDKKDNADEMP